MSQNPNFATLLLCATVSVVACSDDPVASDETTGIATAMDTETSLFGASTAFTTSPAVVTSGDDSSTPEPTSTSGMGSSNAESDSSSGGAATASGSSGEERSTTGEASTGDESVTSGGNPSDEQGSTSEGDGSTSDASTESTASPEDGSSTASTMGAESTSGDTFDSEGSAGPIDVPSLPYILDPYRRTPLAALVPVRPSDIGLSEIAEVTVTVRGDGPGAQDLTATLDPRTEEFQANFAAPELLEEGAVGIPIIGLYPDTDNRVEIRLRDDETTVRSELVITTPSVPEQSETVIVHVADAERMTPGLTWVKYRLYDEQGRIRWVGPNAFSFARNGNMLDYGFGEVTWIGRTVNAWSVPGLEFHHDIIELPNGNVLVCATTDDRTVIKDDGTYTSTQDYIVELDRESNIMNVWDLREYLDVSRTTVAVRNGNWIHMNSLMYDEGDDSIVVSGRFQGIFKITRDGIHGEAVNEGKELVWILAPHLDWGLAGWDGTGPLDPNQYLLTAVDESGVAFGDDVQDNLVGLAPSDDAFHWPIGQHGIQITSRGNGRLSLLTFNNQASFVFDGPGSVANGVAGFDHGDLSNDRSPISYSMLNEYEVDEVGLTVRQTWGFGAGRQELYGSYMSGVIWNDANDHRFMMSNGEDLLVPNQFVHNPHFVEVTPEGETVFHLEIQNTNMSAYRGKKIDPYHPGLPLGG